MADTLGPLPPPRELPAPRLAELRALYRCLPPPPWRMGEQYWELIDSRGFVVLRLETVNSREAAGALAKLWAALPELLGLPMPAKS